MNFWRAVEILNRRKWLIVLSVVVVTALTAAGTKLVGARWVSEVVFMTPERISGAAVNGGAAGEPGDDGSGTSQVAAKNDAATYEAIVKSRDVIEPVCAKLGIAQLPVDFFKNVTFDAKGPRLFNLDVTDPNKTRSEQLANALAEQFITVYRAKRTEQVAKSVKLLEQNVRDSDAKLRAARKRFDDYRMQHKIVGNLNTSIELALAHLKDAHQKRDDLSQHLADAQAQLQKQETRLTGLPSTVSSDKLAEGSPLQKQLQDDLDKSEQQLTGLRRKYTDDYPEVKRALAARDSLQARLGLEKDRLAAPTALPNPIKDGLVREIAQSKQTVAGFVAQAATLDGAVHSAESEIDKFRGIDSPMGALLGEVSQQSDTRNALALRLNNARMAQDAVEQQNPISITNHVNLYNPAVNSTAGRSWRIILIGALAALVCSCSLIIAFDSVDRRLKTVKEAEIVLPTRVLAAIPQPQGSVTYANMARITELQPYSLQAESYRFLGMHLLNECSPGIRSLMVLSAKAEQGSTTALTNLGITLAQAGKRVVLVDANIRTAELDIVFDVPNTFGYTDVLQNPTNEFIERAMHKTTVENLSVITCGSTPSNPWQLFRSQNMTEVSERLYKYADYVLYDTPSALMFTDALNLSPVVDAAFFSIRALEPLTGAEDRIIHQFEQANVQVLGGVLNDVPTAVLEGYHNYQHYYGQGARDAARDRADRANVVTSTRPSALPLIALPEGSPDADTDHEV